MARYAEWRELSQDFRGYHQEDREMRAELSIESIKSPRWSVVGHRGNGPANLSRGAASAAFYAGQHLTGDAACDWWLDGLRLWLERGNGNLESSDVAYWPGGPPPASEALCLGKHIVIPHVLRSSADYCLHWADQVCNRSASPQEAPKIKPGRSPDTRIKRRKEIVRKHVTKKADFEAQETLERMFEEFKTEKIPIPRNRHNLEILPGGEWDDWS